MSDPNIFEMFRIYKFSSLLKRNNAVKYDSFPCSHIKESTLETLLGLN